MDYVSHVNPVILTTEDIEQLKRECTIEETAGHLGIGHPYQPRTAIRTMPRMDPEDITEALKEREDTEREQALLEESKRGQYSEIKKTAKS